MCSIWGHAVLIVVKDNEFSPPVGPEQQLVPVFFLQRQIFFFLMWTCFNKRALKRKKETVHTWKKPRVLHTWLKLTSVCCFFRSSRIIFMYFSNGFSVFPSSPWSSSFPTLLISVSSSSFFPGFSTSCKCWLEIQYVNNHAAEKVRKRCFTNITLALSSSSLWSSWSSLSLASSCSRCLCSCFSFRSLSHLCVSASSSPPSAVSAGAWAASVSQSNV